MYWERTVNRKGLFASGVVFAWVVVVAFVQSADGGDDAFYAVLNAQLEAQAGGEYRTMDRLFELRDSQENVNQALVDLLDYYLGSAAGEILGEFITAEGSMIAPLLERKRDSQLECLPRYKSICADSREVRNRRIEEMLDAIRRGVILKAAE